MRTLELARVIAAAILLAAAIQGCSTAAPDVLDSEEMAKVARKWADPLGVCVLIGIEDREGIETAPLEKEDGFVVASDCAVFERAVARIVASREWFSGAEVASDGRETRVEERTIGDSKTREIYRSGSARRHFMEQARNAGADFLVLLRPGPVEVVYEGVNGSIPWTILVWSLFIPPTWWIPDETYSARFNVSVEVAGVRGDYEGRESSFNFPKKITRNLTDFDRGLALIDVTPLPRPCSASTCRAASKLLSGWFLYECAPIVFDRLQSHLTLEIALARRRAAERERAKAEAAAEAVRFAAESAARVNAPLIPRALPAGQQKPATPDPRGFGLFAGVDCYPAPPPLGTNYCGRDADRMNQVFSGIFPFLSAANRNLLSGPKAARLALDMHVERIVASAPAPGDCIALYLSGAGVAARDAKGEPEIYFLACPADTDADAGDSRFPVVSCCERLAGTGASKIIVILDFAFAAKGLRSIGAPDPLAVHAAVNRLKAVAAKRPGFFLLMADDGTGEALELKAIESGLFTDALANALQSKDSRFDRVSEAVSARVRQEAELRALTQNPFFAGESARQLR